MIRTTSIDYAAILIALKLARLTAVLPPKEGERLATFELTVAETPLRDGGTNLDWARELEMEYGSVSMDYQADGMKGILHANLGTFVDAVQRVRRAMIASRAVQR